MRWIRFTVTCVLGFAAAIFAAVKLGDWEVRRLQREVSTLEREKAELRTFAERLSSSRRVAQVDVVNQHVEPDGRTVTNLLWQEIGAGGVRGRPMAIGTRGVQTYFEAFVIKFEPKFVAQGDPERGASIALFRRLFGDAQTPESAAEIDLLARPPAPASQPADSDDQRLWRRFWELASDPKLAAEFGVRVAQIEAPAVMLRPGDVWEVTLDTAGGLNLKKIAAR